MSQTIASPGQPVAADEYKNVKMICLRCSSAEVNEERAPDGSDAWWIYACRRCNFSWRSIEDVNLILRTTGRMPSRLREQEPLKGA
jgi:hypothetical protein